MTIQAHSKIIVIYLILDEIQIFRPKSIIETRLIAGNKLPA